MSILAFPEEAQGPRMAEGFDSPEKVALWASGHEAKCQAHWEEQRRWNERKDRADQVRDAALLEIRKALWKMVGVASTVSGLIVGVVVKYVG